eukprot:3495518-Prorocentrum_lima.AAC.1
MMALQAAIGLVKVAPTEIVTGASTPPFIAADAFGSVAVVEGPAITTAPISKPMLPVAPAN